MAVPEPSDVPDPGVPAHYSVPGHDSMAFISALLDRDSGLETPAQAWMRANAIKYLIRAPRKGGARDYRKAADYIGRLLACLEGGCDVIDGVLARGERPRFANVKIADSLDAVRRDAHAVFGFVQGVSCKTRAHSYLTYRKVPRTGDDTAVERAALDLVERAVACCRK